MGGKTDTISRNQIIKDYKDGGCRMVHLNSFIKSLKLSWMRRLLVSEASWKNLFFTMFKTDQFKLETFGNYYAKQLSKKFRNDFWIEVLHIFWEFSKITSCQTNNDTLSNPLWFNDQIEIGGSPVFYKYMFDHGIRFVSDLFDSEGNFYTYESLCEICDTRIPILTYFGLKNAVLYKWPQLNTLDNNTFFPFIPYTIRIFIKNAKGTQVFYNAFISKIKCKNKYLTKWENELLLPDSTFLSQLMSRVFSFTSDSSLRWFQYRISNRILATNRYLYKLNILQSDMCTFCHNQSESILHLFVECVHVEDIWSRLEQWIFIKCGIFLNLNKLDILFGKISSKNDALNLIILLVKQYIYKKRYRQEILNFEGLKYYILDYYLVEKHICYINGNFKKFNQRWQQLAGLINS